MPTRRSRATEYEVIDANDIPYAPDAIPRAPSPRRPGAGRSGRRGRPADVLRLLRAVLVLYAVWAWLWFLPHWYAPPASFKGVFDLLASLPRPPFL